MATYLQMGHDSENLMPDSEPDLAGFKGAILSPVNSKKPQITSQILKASCDFDLVFDPQMYFPQAERGFLPNWDYFPSDVDTVDTGSNAWWEQLVEDVVTSCVVMRPNAICSPAKVPSVYADGYYALSVFIGNLLVEALSGSGIRPVQTGIISLPDLTVRDRPLEIASILSSSQAEEIYLVLIGDTEPRRELDKTEELKGAMRLIKALRDAGLSVIVPFASSDVVLWKAAGATHSATGKFFNLRRFTKSRFAEPTEGGQQIPYWFEESLLAFLRESDILRVQAKDMLGEQSMTNPFSQVILQRFQEAPEKAWLAASWRQYLFSMIDLEKRLSQRRAEPLELVRNAEQQWIALEDARVYMEERRNNGEWLRSWLRALVEYQEP